MSQHFRSHSTENYQLDLIRMMVNWAEIPDDPHGPEMRNMLAAAEGVIQALRVNPPGESGDSKLIETMLPHRYSDRYRRYAPISQAAYLRSIHTGAGC